MGKNKRNKKDKSMMDRSKMTCNKNCSLDKCWDKILFQRSLCKDLHFQSSSNYLDMYYRDLTCNAH